MANGKRARGAEFAVPGDRPEEGAPVRGVWLVVLAVAVVSLSTSVVFIRWSTLPPVYLSAFRLLAAAVVMAPLFAADWRRHRPDRAGGGGWKAAVRRLSPALLPGVVLGLHFVLWVAGARMTRAANAVLAVNLAPIVLPFLLYFVAGERINRRERAGTALALAGLAVMAVGDARIDPALAKGDLVCVAAMLLLAFYLALGRRNGRLLPGHWLYMMPVCLAGGCTCLAAGLAAGVPLGPPSTREWLLVLALAIVPTIGGHGLINLALRHVRGQVVGLCSQAQFVSAALLGFLAFGEVPRASFLVAAAGVLGGAWVAVGAGAGARGRPRPETR